MVVIFSYPFWCFRSPLARGIDMTRSKASADTAVGRQILQKSQKIFSRVCWDGLARSLRACLRTQKSPMNLHILLYFFDHLPQQTGDAIHS